MFLVFSDLSYNLNNNEIILIQSLILSDYYDDLMEKSGKLNFQRPLLCFTPLLSTQN